MAVVEQEGFVWRLEIAAVEWAGQVVLAGQEKYGILLVEVSRSE
jgi:hypothetical protein